jgi:ABC-type antimicrobial peptide transport system permease subunit
VSLRANIFRTVLTLLGIVIGVSSVGGDACIGEGAKQRVVRADRLHGDESAGGAAAIPQRARLLGPIAH